jgi:hypothetical protein
MSVVELIKTVERNTEKMIIHVLGMICEPDIITESTVDPTCTEGRLRGYLVILRGETGLIIVIGEVRGKCKEYFLYIELSVRNESKL